MSSAREQIIQATCQLLEAQGYHATGLNQIIKESGAPKGSLYYYFPEGKEELATEAVLNTGAIVEGRILSSLEAVADPAEAVYQFILTIIKYMVASDYYAGGPITTVALESAISNERINAACREIYARWQAAFKRKLVSSGIDDAHASRLGALIIAAIEGGIILSRTEHNALPLKNVAEELKELIRVIQQP